MAKISKKRLAQIREKYSFITENDKNRKALGVRKYNKLMGERAEIRKDIRYLDHLYKNTPVKSVEDQEGLYHINNRLRALKKQMYAKDFEIRKGTGFIKTSEGKDIAVDGDELTDDELKIVTSLEKRIEDYQIGDHTIERFYTVYGFNVIDTESLTIFARGEGLI